MRLRKKPWARPELEACNFFIVKPSEYKGKWRDSFNNDNPIYLELGCGKGTFVAIHGSENPNINYVAIDIKDEVLVLAKRNIEKAYNEKGLEINNLKLMAQEIFLINDVFSKEDIVDRIYINFCNPWPKERHKKRRLTYPTQLEKYKEFLSKDGKIYFKTDDDELFDESLDYFKEAGFEIEYITYDLHNSDFVGNVRTEHENMFSEQGIKIKFLIAKR